MKLFTIGYEGRSPQEFAKLLQDNRVTLLVDVRDSARSRARGFSAMQLMEVLLKAGIDYRHERDLGNPMEIRSLFHDGDLAEGRRLYRKLLSNGRRESVNRLVELIGKKRRVCIMCVERDVEACHRDLIAAKIAQIDPTIQVIDL